MSVPVSSSTPASPRLHKPGPIQKGLEVVGGVLSAATKVPGAALPCLVAGAMRGVGGDSVEISRMGNAMDITNGCQSAVALTFALGGGASAGQFVSTLLTKGIAGGATVAMVSKGGSSLELARQISEGIAAKEKPDTPVANRAVRGLWVGARTAVVGGAKVGYSEGVGLTAGLCEGVQQTPAVLRGAFDPYPRNYGFRDANPAVRWGKTAMGFTAGVVGSALYAPVGLVQGMGEAMFPGLLNPTRLKAVMAAEGAVFGAVAASVTGSELVGTLVGAGVGAGLCFALSHLGREGHQERTLGRLRAATGGVHDLRTQLGDPIATNNRDYVSSGVVGMLAGVQSGFNEGYRLVSGESS